MVGLGPRLLLHEILEAIGGGAGLGLGLRLLLREILEAIGGGVGLGLGLRLTSYSPHTHAPKHVHAHTDSSEDSLKALIQARQQSRGKQADNFFDALEHKYAKKTKTSSPRASGSKGTKASNSKGTKGRKK